MRTLVLSAWFIISSFIFHSNLAGADGPPGSLAEKMLDGETRHGLVVQIGCGGGELLADLARVRGDVVQGLDTDPAAITQANARLQKPDGSGSVTACRFDGVQLPYADHLINVLIITDWKRAAAAGLKADEVRRVLAPFGVLYLGGETLEIAKELAQAGMPATPVHLADGYWLKAVQPYPAQMDEWPQPRHDASRAAVSRDELIGPITALRWLDGPQFNGFNADRLAISAGGRVFFILAPNPLRPAEALRIEAHDAFNGTKLWETPVGVTWAAADGVRVFTQLKGDGPVTALDAATGQPVQSYPASGPGMLYQGMLIVHDSAQTWTAFDAASAQKLRVFVVENAPAENPALIAENRLIVLESPAAASAGSPTTQAANPTRIVCFDLSSGRRLWTAANIEGGELLSCQRGLILTAARVAGAKGFRGAGPLTLHAYRLADGVPLWAYRSKTKIGAKAAAFYLGERLWVYDDLSVGKDLRYREAPCPNGDCTGYVALDPLTGRRVAADQGVVKEFGRCGPDYATQRYVLGMDLSVYDLQAGQTFACYFVRGDCDLSSLPANGLLYAYGHECVCRPYIGSIVAAASEPVPDLAALPRTAGEALEKGPAYGLTAAAADDPRDWPIYRHDARRSGATALAVGPELRPAWRVPVGRQITPPVIAGDLALVASIPDHRIVALDLKTGATRWSYTCGGRVDSPPTFYRGLVLAGSADGWVYCLRAADGQLVWRYRAAPHPRSILVRGQLESSWPVNGSVLVDGGVAYVVAGRHADLDGGLFCSALEPASGKLRWSKPIIGFGEFRSDVNESDTGRRKSRGLSATCNDLLISDGQTLFIGAVGMNLETRAVSCRPVGAALFGGGPRLLGDNTAPTPAWANRSAWSLEGPAWTDDGLRGRHGDRVVWGNVIVFNSERVFAVRHDFPNNATKDKCIATVYAVANRSAAVSPASAPTSAPALPPDGKLPRLWSRTYEQDHPRLKALALSGDLLLMANQKGGSAIGQTDVDAGELLMFNAADGQERGRMDLGCSPLFDGIAVGQGRILVSTQSGWVQAFLPAADQ